MKTFHELKGRILIASLLAGFLLGLASLSNVGYRIESVVLDGFFISRYKLFGSLEIDPRLVMVGIDEHTIAEIGKPQLLWQRDLAKMIEQIKQDDPAVVALDLVISPSTHALKDEDLLKTRLEDEALELGLTATDGPPVIFAEVYSEDFLVFGQADKNSVMSPHEVVLDLLLDEEGESDRLGIANIAGDTDGVLRRGKIFRSKARDGRLERPINLAFRMLELGTQEPLSFQRESERGTILTWMGKTVPILFDDSFLLNYPGPTENNTQEPHHPSKALTFPIISGQSVLRGENPEGYFKDKFVLIAPTASSLDDEKIVPLDPEYLGGGVHLTTLNMFLTDQFISRNGVVWVLMTLLLALIGVKIGRSGLLWPTVVTIGLLPIFTFGTFVFLGAWVPTIFPLLAFAASGLLGYMERLLTIERDRALVRSTFARMVSPQVMNHVLANYRTLSNGERKVLTVLFSDINDFTPVCENHTPEEVIQMLSLYFSKMVDVIMKYDGYLKQYVGDEIMVIFGAPDDSEDHATRAVLTALEMREVLAQMKLEAGGKPGFHEVKIGINTGSVVVGKVGPESRWEYAAVGDDVNLGARVMSVAKKLGLDIGVSAATKKRFEFELEQNPSLEHKVKWISQGIQEFKGKTSRMEVFGIEKSEN